MYFSHLDNMDMTDQLHVHGVKKKSINFCEKDTNQTISYKKKSLNFMSKAPAVPAFSLFSLPKTPKIIQLTTKFCTEKLHLLSVISPWIPKFSIIFDETWGLASNPTSVGFLSNQELRCNLHLQLYFSLSH